MTQAAWPRARWISLGVWVALVAGVVTAFWPLFSFDPQEGVTRAVGGIEGALFDPSGEDPRLIGILALWMLHARRGRIAAAWRGGRGQPAAGASLLAGSVAVHAWATHVGGPDLQVHSLQLLVLGGAALLGGVEAMRAVRLPVLFLFLAMPIPAALLNGVLLPLQLATVEVCVAILRLFGMQVYGFGDQIFTQRGIFHVIETCSGVRIVQTLVMSAVVYAELFGRRTGRALLLLALAPLVGLAVNLARILSIILNPLASISSVHTTQGAAMVVVGVLVLAGIDQLLERARPGQPRSAEPGESLLGRPPDWRIAAIYLALAALIAAQAWTPRWQQDTSATSIRLLPREIDGRSSNGQMPDLAFLGSVHFSNRLLRGYQLPETAEATARGRLPEIRVFFGTDDHTNRRGSMLSDKTAYPGAAWAPVALSGAELADGTPVELGLFVHPDSKRRMVVHWQEGFATPGIEALRAWAGLERSRFRRQERAFVWRVSAEVRDASELDQARSELLEFASSARDAWAEAVAQSQERQRASRR